jgi:hypothetical protein
MAEASRVLQNKTLQLLGCDGNRDKVVSGCEIEHISTSGGVVLRQHAGSQAVKRSMT